MVAQKQRSGTCENYCRNGVSEGAHNVFLIRICVRFQSHCLPTALRVKLFDLLQREPIQLSGLASERRIATDRAKEMFPASTLNARNHSRGPCPSAHSPRLRIRFDIPQSSSLNSAMTVKDTTAMIAGMTPVLAEGRRVYCCETDRSRAAGLGADAFAMMQEDEGVTLILPEEVATAQGYDTALVMQLITLNVFSDLEGVGLTAAVAGALTEVGISCNVVAAYHHDHVLVPQADAERAMDALRAAQAKAARL